MPGDSREAAGQQAAAANDRQIKSDPGRNEEMKVISATTIAKLIEAHMEKDEKKFLAYANFIADAYEEQGEGRRARIIRSRLDGTYKKQPKAVLDQAK